VYLFLKDGMINEDFAMNLLSWRNPGIFDYQDRLIQVSGRDQLTNWIKRKQNGVWVKVRCRLEYVFQGVRCAGIERAEFIIQMTKIAYNFRRLNVLVPLHS
jgi:hypothetical protein